MDIKSKMEQIIKDKGLNQVQFIRLLDKHGISRNTAITVFKNGTNVRLDTFVIAARAIGASIDDALITSE